MLSFNVPIISNNLGGLGGFLPVTPDTPREIHFKGVGRTLAARVGSDDDYDYDDDYVAGEGVLFDLRIFNLTEYRGWNTYLNGVKVTNDGAFGVINFLAPRTPDMGMSWDTEHTYVYLMFLFTNSKSQVPINVERTFLTFYDFDTGM